MQLHSDGLAVSSVRPGPNGITEVVYAMPPSHTKQQWGTTAMAARGVCNIPWATPGQMAAIAVAAKRLEERGVKYCSLVGLSGLRIALYACQPKSYVFVVKPNGEMTEPVGRDGKPVPHPKRAW